MKLKSLPLEISSVIIDGNKNERSMMLNSMTGVDVAITSYDLMRRDVDLYATHAFHTLILDEAQAFKNYYTQTAQAVKELKADNRFALTGTNVENRIEDLWSLFECVFPSLFPNRKTFVDLPRETIAKRSRPFLLRRLKKDVLHELPDKIESIHSNELFPEQKKLYLAQLSRLQKETMKQINEEGFQKNRISILAGLTRLRQLCCHPALYVKDYEGGSAKFDQLMEILLECRESGRRVLVFSQFTEMLRLISKEINTHQLSFFYLEGSTPARERVEMCAQFNNGERDVFLISLKAGGTGLNLTGADTVILYDLWWNPAVEQQAVDRAHRIGQSNVVQVIRMVSQGTVEEKMYELQQKKKSLVDTLIQSSDDGISSLTEEEIREILMLDRLDPVKIEKYLVVVRRGIFTAGSLFNFVVSGSGLFHRLQYGPEVENFLIFVKIIILYLRMKSTLTMIGV